MENLVAKIRVWRVAHPWAAKHLPAVIAALAIIAIGQTVSRTLDRTPPIEIMSVRMSPSRIAAGGDTSTVVSAKVHRYCPAELVRELVSDAAGHPMQVYDVTSAVLPRDGDEFHNFGRPLHVPHGFTLGPAVYRSWLRFRCNPIQEWWPIIVRAPDAPVVVDPPL